jgi:hypothetical protein
MVNNSTNVNKWDNHLSPSLTEHQNRQWNITLEIQAPTWDIYTHVAGLPVTAIQLSSLVTTPGYVLWYNCF